jgi:hypothetical protein
MLSKSWVPIVRASIAVVEGIGLAAVYLIPAAWEQRWADISQATDDPGEMIENSWLFARHADPLMELHDLELRRVSIIAVAMIAVALAGLLVSRLRNTLPAIRRWWFPLALIPQFVLFFHLPAGMESAAQAPFFAVSLAMAGGAGGADGYLLRRRCLASRFCPALAALCGRGRMRTGLSGRLCRSGQTLLPGLRR